MRVFCAYLLIAIHLLYTEGGLLLYSIFGSRRVIIAHSEKIFLRSAQKILYFLKITLGIRIEYKPPARPFPEQAIIVCNHQSYFDVPIIRTFFAQHRIRFIAKQTLRRHFPAVSRLMRVQNHAFIERQANLFNTMATIRRFVKRLVGTSLSPVIFPEGTRAKDGALLPFFVAGLRQAATHLNIPIVLVLIRSSYQLNKLSEVRRRSPLSAPIQIETLRYIDDPQEKRRCVRQVELLEREYQAALLDGGGGGDGG